MNSACNPPEPLPDAMFACMHKLDIEATNRSTPETNHFAPGISFAALPAPLTTTLVNIPVLKWLGQENFQFSCPYHFKKYEGTFLAREKPG